METTRLRCEVTEPFTARSLKIIPTQAEPDSKKFVVSLETVRDVSRHLGADGVLRWEVPNGDWVVQRVVALPTGAHNSPAPPEATGLEVEKMSREARPVLPVLSGRLVGSADQSDRFLWDLRRMVADRIARYYVGGLRDLCHEHGPLGPVGIVTA